MRTFAPDDLSGINALIRAAEPVDHACRLNNSGESHWQAPADPADALVIVEHDAVIGFAAIQQQVPEQAWHCELLVHPAQRRRGVGRQLWAGLQQRARQREIDLVGLVLDTSAAGRGFVEAQELPWQGSWHEMLMPISTVTEPVLPPGYSLRRATMADAPAFLAVFAETFKTHRFLLPPAVEQLHHWWGMIPDFERTNGVALLEHGGELAGISSVRSRPMYWDGQVVLAGHIGPIGIMPAHRGQGLAPLLLQANASWAQANAINYLSLYVDSINTRALALYEEFGFKRTRDELWWRWNRSEAA